MNEDRVVGTARNLGGKAQEGFGRVTGDTKNQVEGVINQAAGAAQDLYWACPGFVDKRKRLPQMPPKWFARVPWTLTIIFAIPSRNARIPQHS